jgi:hypothetical protein
MDSTKVRRANSCPEMKKSPVSSVKDNVSRTLDETDEESNVERATSAEIAESVASTERAESVASPERAESADGARSVMSNGLDAISDAGNSRLATIETQTDNFWPMPYEHLFLGIFPTLGVDVKSSPGPVSSLGGGSQERYSQPSINEVLDR